ncbi:MAG: GAF domain-containing protein [Actinomycetota bacterium]|nr:GAF domain-containing protein [Actinomycetota bacterium]
MPAIERARRHGGKVTSLTRPDSYERLSDVFHQLLSEQGLDAVLETIADHLGELVPVDSLTIYQANVAERMLVPVLARDQWAEQILQSRAQFGQGITGWAVENREAVLANQAHLDPRVTFIPGTPMEPEALICIPLIARGSIKGALNLYRVGEEGRFSDQEFELAKRFGDAAALAIDNAETRQALEHQAQTDPLTGLYNHRFFHERLRSELIRAGRTHDAVSLLMIDIDDFKKVNDVHGHGTGDQVLISVSEILKATLRGSDVVCRLGGEEFGVIMPSSDAGDALGLATRLLNTVSETDFEQVGHVTVSIGVAQGPDHAMNPRALVACSEAAMMTAKAKGKDRIALFDESSNERPGVTTRSHDVRSLAHMKMLQSLAGKLNRSNDVKEIGATIANELRTLIDYMSCLIWVRIGDELHPIAARGELAEVMESDPETLIRPVGEGIVGHVAAAGRPMLVGNGLEEEHAVQVPGTPAVEESIVAVPLTYGSRTVGVIYISSLGVDQFDEDDVRLMEVLAGHASVALENARLYESQRREAENAKALLNFADHISELGSFFEIGQKAVRETARWLDATQCSLWLKDASTGDFECAAHTGYANDPAVEELIRVRVPAESGQALLAKHRSPVLLSPSEQNDYFVTPGMSRTREIAVAPLRDGEGVSGWLVVRNPSNGHHFVDERMRLLEGIAYQCSVAMQKALLYKSEKENADIANSLLDFSRQLAITEDLDRVLSLTVELSARILGSPHTSIWLQDISRGGSVVLEAIWGYEEDRVAQLSQIEFAGDDVEPFLTRPAPFKMMQLEFMQIPGMPADPPDSAIAVAPLRLDGGRFGGLFIGAPAYGDYEFSERKMRLLAGIANQAEMAINRVDSFENLERTFLSTVEALANALEAKDEYTSDHARSITDMALDVGAAMNLDVVTLKRLELAALFHDIGKIGIPSDIIRKPGPLADDERVIMETHPELGERILEPIERLVDVRPIVRACHERYDGGGYPDGKKGDEIPIEARIIFVCDAFHAMTTDRPYRAFMSDEEAYAQLRSNAGSQFDPDVVEVFLETMHNRGAVALDKV